MRWRLTRRALRAEIPDTEIGGTGVATTEGARPLGASRGKAPPAGTTSAAVTGVKAQKLRRNLKKSGLPIFYRVAALAFACVGFALIASSGSEACVPIPAAARIAAAACS